jgi:hypothetical protein
MPISTPALLLAAMTGAPTVAPSGRQARNRPVGIVFGCPEENFSDFAQERPNTVISGRNNDQHGIYLSIPKTKGLPL